MDGLDGRVDGMEEWVVNAKGVVRLTAVKSAHVRAHESVNNATPSFFLSLL